MIVVFIVVLVVFGPQKLPELARGLGKLMAEFRKASTDFRSAFEEEMRDLERQALQAERKKGAEAVAAAAAAASSTDAGQAATLGTPTGTETPREETQPAEGITEAPVVSPVTESVPRSSEKPGEEPGEIKTEATTLTNAEDATHDVQHLT